MKKILFLIIKKNIKIFRFDEIFFNFSNQNFKNNSGQALVALLIFITMSIAFIGGMVAVSVINTQSSSKYNQSETAYYIAESGIEEAIIQLLRNPGYANTAQEIPIGKGSAKVLVTTENNTKIILSVGTYGSLVRKIEVKGDYSDTFKITSWKEIN